MKIHNEYARLTPTLMQAAKGTGPRAVPARLDRDRAARPLTRLITHARSGDCVGPYAGLQDEVSLETLATGDRIEARRRIIWAAE